jgi:hypothetical protein
MIEIITAWGAMAIGMIACLAFWRFLLREVRKGRLGRFRTTVLQAVAAMVLGSVPVTVAAVVTWVTALGGVALFTREAGNDGVLVGLGLIGMFVALGAAALVAVVMIFQALTGFGSSDVSG